MDVIFLPVAYAGVITEAPTLATILLRVLEFLLQTVGTVIAIAFVCSGLVYIFSAGNEKILEMAKRWTVYTALGCLLVFGSLVVLSFLNSFFV